MWTLAIFVTICGLSLIFYGFMHQQTSRIIEMQGRTFHSRSKAQVKSRSVTHLRYLYILMVLAIIVYSSFAYVSIFS